LQSCLRVFNLLRFIKLLLVVVIQLWNLFLVVFEVVHQVFAVFIGIVLLG